MKLHVLSIQPITCNMKPISPTIFQVKTKTPMQTGKKYTSLAIPILGLLIQGSSWFCGDLFLGLSYEAKAHYPFSNHWYSFQHGLVMWAGDCMLFVFVCWHYCLMPSTE